MSAADTQPDSSDTQWWKVEASLIVKAASEDGAIDLAAAAIRKGYDSVKGVLPVGSFNARPHSDHITKVLDRKTEEN
jgi:hypothetical protein